MAGTEKKELEAESEQDASHACFIQPKGEAKCNFKGARYSYATITKTNHGMPEKLDILISWAGIQLSLR